MNAIKFIIDNLLDSGYSYKDIKDAMCDGEFLRSEQISKLESEIIYNFCCDKIN